MHFLSFINEVAAGPHYVIAKGLNDSSFLMAYILYVQEVVTQPKILNRTILYNLVHVT